MSLLRPHTIIFAAILLLALIFMLPFATTLLLAAITAYAMHPLVHGIRKILHSYRLSLLVSLLIIIVPFELFFRYAAGDITPLLGDIKSFGGEANTLLEFVRVQLSRYGLETYAAGLQNILSNMTEYIVQVAATILKALPRALLNIAIYLFATYYFLRDGHKIVKYIDEFIDTLDSEEKSLFRSIMNGVKKSFDILFTSYISMAAITAALAWAGYYAIGVPYSAFLGLLTGLFAFLPLLGAWMIYVPAAIYEYSTGNVNAAILVVLYGLLVLTALTDLIIRPAIGARKTGVSPLTIFLGFFSGPIIMGATGMIVGPIVFVLAETVLKEYIEFKVREKKGVKKS